MFLKSKFDNFSSLNAEFFASLPQFIPFHKKFVFLIFVTLCLINLKLMFAGMYVKIFLNKYNLNFCILSLNYKN